MIARSQGLSEGLNDVTYITPIIQTKVQTTTPKKSTTEQIHDLCLFVHVKMNQIHTIRIRDTLNNQ